VKYGRQALFAVGTAGQINSSRQKQIRLILFSVSRSRGGFKELGVSILAHGNLPARPRGPFMSGRSRFKQDKIRSHKVSHRSKSFPIPPPAKGGGIRCFEIWALGQGIQPMALDVVGIFKREQYSQFFIALYELGLILHVTKKSLTHSLIVLKIVTSSNLKLSYFW